MGSLAHDDILYLTVRDSGGGSVRRVAVGEGSSSRFSLMGDDYIELRFTLTDNVIFPLGCYVDLWEQTSGEYVMSAEVRRCLHRYYEVTEPYAPAYNEQTAAYDYTLRLDAYYHAWLNKIAMLVVKDESGALLRHETSWTYTNYLREQARVVMKNFEALGMDYHGTPYRLNVDETAFDRVQKAITYDKENILDALYLIAKTWECDCWVTGEVVHFGRLETVGAGTHVRLGEEARAIQCNKSQGNFATRLYCYGSTRNLTNRYRKTLWFEVTQTDGKRVDGVYYRDITDDTRLLDTSCFRSSLRSEIRLSSQSVAGETRFVDGNGVWVTDRGSARITVAPMYETLTGLLDNASYHVYIRKSSVMYSRSAYTDITTYEAVKGIVDSGQGGDAVGSPTMLYHKPYLSGGDQTYPYTAQFANTEPLDYYYIDLSGLTVKALFYPDIPTAKTQKGDDSEVQATLDDYAARGHFTIQVERQDVADGPWYPLGAKTYGYDDLRSLTDDTVRALPRWHYIDYDQDATGLDIAGTGRITSAPQIHFLSIHGLDFPRTVASVPYVAGQKLRLTLVKAYDCIFPMGLEGTVALVTIGKRVETRVRFEGDTDYTAAFMNFDYLPRAERAAMRLYVRAADHDVERGMRYRVAVEDLLSGKVSSAWYSSAEQNVVETLTAGRLRLPEQPAAATDRYPSYSGRGYLDAYENMRDDDVVEGVAVFEEAYPHTVFAVTRVETFYTVLKTWTDEEGREQPLRGNKYRLRMARAAEDDHGNYYVDATAEEVEFDQEYTLDGVDLQLTFQSGEMDGMTFTVVPVKYKGQTWLEVEPSEDYARLLPSSDFHPTVEGVSGGGTMFALTGYDPIFMSSTAVITEAEGRLLSLGRDYLSKAKRNDQTFEVTLTSAYALSHTFEKGDMLTVDIDSSITCAGETERTLRVIGQAFKLDMPFDEPVYTLGETAQYSRLKQIEDSLDAMTVGAAYDASDTGRRQARSQKESTPTIVTVETTGATSVLERLGETHTLWGQPFDGTQDVSGDLTDVGNITARGTVIGTTVTAQTVNAETVNADNAVVDGVLSVTDSIRVDEDIEAHGTVTCDILVADKEIATHGSIICDDTISGKTLLIDNEVAGSVQADTITSTGLITTQDLKVTGRAEFFELMIDQIRASGGAVLYTPADGFEVEAVRMVNTSGEEISIAPPNGRYCYKIYWRVEDSSGAVRRNMWRVGDMAVCQTFNAPTNKYWWALVRGVSQEATTSPDDRTIACHYIMVSAFPGMMNAATHKRVGAEYVGTLDIDKGDKVAMLGHKKQTGESDEEARRRGSAIYISAYTSMDEGYTDADGTEVKTALTPPFYATYAGVATFELGRYRRTYIDANGSVFYGDFMAEGDTDLYATYMQVNSTVGQVSLKVDGLSDGLRATGIDVTNGKIALTADRFTLTSNSGDSSLGVDAEGNLRVYGVVKAQALYYNFVTFSTSERVITLRPETDGGTALRLASGHLYVLPEPSQYPGLEYTLRGEMPTRTQSTPPYILLPNGSNGFICLTTPISIGGSQLDCFAASAFWPDSGAYGGIAVYGIMRLVAVENEWWITEASSLTYYDQEIR